MSNDKKISQVKKLVLCKSRLTNNKLARVLKKNRKRC